MMLTPPPLLLVLFLSRAGISLLLPLLFIISALAFPAAASSDANAPRRVIALAPSIAELVCSLDACGLLVGRTDYTDFNSSVTVLPSVGAYNRPDLEKIASLSPDLCLAIADGTPPALIKRLKALGIRAEVLTITNIDSLPDALLSLGRFLHKEEMAERRAAEFRNELRRLKMLAESKMRDKDPPKILFQLQEQPIIAASENTFAGDLIRKAGGDNVIKDSGGRAYPIIGKEELLRIAPDLILFTGMSSETYDPQSIEHNAFGMRVIRLPSDVFTRPSLNSLNALERLIHIFYGDDGQN